MNPVRQSTCLYSVVAQSEAYYLDILDLLPELVCRFLADGTLTFVNQAYCQYFGKSSADLLGHSFFDLIPAEDRDVPRQQIDLLLQTRGVLTSSHRVIDKQGVLRWQDWTNQAICSPEGTVIEFQAVGRDITDRKSVEDALRESEHRFRSIFDNVSVGMALSTPSGCIITANEASSRFLGYSLDELAGMHISRLTHPDDLALDVRLLESLVAGERNSYVIDKRYLRKDGTVVWGRLTIAGIREPQGTLRFVAAVLEDIEDRKHTEEALRRSEARYRSLTNDVLDTSPVGIAIVNANFQVVWINQALEQFFGLRCQEVVEQDQRALIVETIAALFSDPSAFSARLLAAYQHNTGIENFECHLLAGDHHPERWLEHWSQPIREGLYAGGRIEYYTDITERKRVEMLLRRQAERERLLAAMTRHVHQSLDLDRILMVAVADVRHTLEADWVFVVRFHPDGLGTITREVRLLASSTMPDVAHLPICAPPSCLQSCDDRADTRQHPMCLIELMVQADIQAKACVPITQHLDDCSTQTWGLLVVCSRAERQWQPAEVDLLQQISNQLAIAVHRSELYQQLQIANQELQRLATLDGLTQIANRHRFDHHLRQEWQRLMREQAPLSIILCDVDHFKRYNDTYGHLAGDNCLVEIAQAIHRAVRRPADLAARYGGEEFAIILPNTDHDGAIQIAQAIDAEMTRLNLSHISSPIANGRVTLSLGIATVLPSGDSSPAALLDRADHALYQAKAQGRNQYCVAAAVKPL